MKSFTLRPDTFTLNFNCHFTGATTGRAPRSEPCDGTHRHTSYSYYNRCYNSHFRHGNQVVRGQDGGDNDIVQ